MFSLSLLQVIMKHFEKYRYMLEVLKEANPQLRKAILKNSDDGLICILAEIIMNLVDGHLQTSPKQIKQFRPYKNTLRSIHRHCSSSKKVSKKKLRRSVVQVGGALPFLIPLLIPLIAKAALAGAVSTGVGVATKKIISG